MTHLPENITRTIAEFQKLPGIGQKTAERLTFYLLRKPEADVEAFGATVRNLKKGIRYCHICSNLADEETCAICKDSRRDAGIICVVEEVLDLIALEKSGAYKGVYHVLHGVISPVEGIGPDELRIAELLARLKSGTAKELIFALNPSLEGEATMTYILRQVPDLKIKVTRLARGIPVGGDLEYADSQTIKQALAGRREY